MDDIFEVLIYVLFIGASVIGGIYKNYAKKKEEERRLRQIQVSSESISEEQGYIPSQEREQTSRTIEDFINQQFDVETEPINSTIEEDEFNEKQEGATAFKIANETLLSDNMPESDLSISSELESQSESEGLIEQENAYSIKTHEDDKILDLKQAVIYSAILNRPYS